MPRRLLLMCSAMALTLTLLVPGMGVCSATRSGSGRAGEYNPHQGKRHIGTSGRHLDRRLPDRGHQCFWERALPLHHLADVHQQRDQDHLAPSANDELRVRSRVVADLVVELPQVEQPSAHVGVRHGQLHLHAVCRRPALPDRVRMGESYRQLQRHLDLQLQLA
jgi:hypothetical protein